LRSWIIGSGVAAVLCLLTWMWVLGSRSSPSSQVVAYCAQDQVYAEPILRDFEKETGVQVRAVYDNEAVKTVGLANRLIAEAGHPQCDVFWGNEELRTRQLVAREVLRATNAWASFGYRSRRLVVNTNRLALASAPRGLLELTNQIWRGKLALAYPQFGTTATHFHALRQAWGVPPWEIWLRALAANRPMLVDGNSVVVSTVGRGDAWIGLTDSDDIAAGQREGLPVAAIPMTDETLLIPNTVAVTRDAPHPQAAQQLFEYLQRPEVAERLVASGALEGVSTAQMSQPALRVDWDALLAALESSTTTLNETFLR